MKSGVSTTTVLMLALLLQAGAGVQSLPCVLGHTSSPTMTSAPATAEMAQAHHGHPAAHAAVHTSHHVPAPAVSSASDDDASRDCCDDMSAIGCASHGCAAGTGNGLTPATLRPLPVTLWAVLERLPVWLPDYGAPDPRFFRPPIA